MGQKATCNNPPPRLQSGGWFTRAFSATSGVLIAWILLASIAVAIPIFLLCGGLATTAHLSTADRLARRKELTALARPFALDDLQKHGGIIAVSDDAGAVELDGDIIFAGTGRDASGRLREFGVTYRMATFSKTALWDLRQVVIDKEVKYEKP